MFTTILIYLALIVAAFFMYGIHQYILDIRHNLPPGPAPLPFIGSVASLKNSYRPWRGFSELAKRWGSIFTFYMGQYRMVILCSPEVINEAIVQQGKIFSGRPAAIVPGFENFPTGVLFSNGEKWQHNRRFSLKALRDFGMGKIAIVDKIHDELDFFLAEIAAQSEKPFTPQRLLANTVSNVICSLVFGKRFHYDDAEFITFLDQMNKLTSKPFSRRLLYFSFPLIRFLASPEQAIDGRNMQTRIARLLKKAIEEHREDFNQENLRDFPDLFIQSEMTRDGVSFDEFSLVMMDMFAAGTETTATALNWTLLYLATYPDIQRRCHDAIDRVIDTDRYPTLEDRPKLVYLDAVMCEVLRHATIVPMALFHCNLNESANVAHFDIPTRTLVAYNVWGVHHDETYWTEPTRFNPDRWINADGKLLSHSSHFMPFGAGPRICLGELLARVEYFVFLVALLQRFTFASADANVSLDEGIPGITHAPPKYRVIATKR